MNRVWASIQSLWLRLSGFLRARLFRRELAPGRFEEGRASSWRGYITTAPIVAPERDYVVYVPRGYSRWRRTPLVVVCHGCRQSPEDIANLARITERADRDGWLVLLPRQAEPANRYRCWNWFEFNTIGGGGEAAIVAAQIVAARRHYRAKRERVWVLGLSAGAALAAVLGLRHPRLVRGVMAHSGLACAAASSPATALAVMAHGPDNDVSRVADEARAVDTARGLSVPLLVVHGEIDREIPVAHADRLATMAREKSKSDAIDIVIVRGVNHLLVPAVSGATSEYGTLTDRNVSKDVTKAVTDWLTRTLPASTR
jgi:poly(hydroxyalkanoate) depolymerase family esterase